MTQKLATGPVVKPEIFVLDELLTEVDRGLLRVPRFQRPFVWGPRQMRELFDSIERGFPIGSLLLWEPDQPVESLDTIGPIPIDLAPKSGRVRYVLDGHQRLTTLYSALKLPKEHPDSGGEEVWKWRVFRDLTKGLEPSGGFAHHPRQPPPHTHFPLRVILRTMDFLDWAGELRDALDGNELLYGTYLHRAQDLADKVKNYKIAAIMVRGGTMAQAVEIFSRLNSKGQSISKDQMVSALTYQPGGFNLSEYLDSLEEVVADGGLAGVPRTAIFQAVLGVSGEDDVQRSDWDQIAHGRAEQLASAQQEATAAVTAATRFLRAGIGVPAARLLPYAQQLTFLAVYFHHRPQPDDQDRALLRQWFWATSWSGWFATANSTDIKSGILAMRELATDREAEPPGLHDSARAYPTQFDMRSARVRTLLLWQSTRPPLGIDGTPLHYARLLGEQGPRAYRYVSHSRSLPSDLRSDPANRVFLPGIGIREKLCGLDDSVRDQVLHSHWITPEAFEHLRSGDVVAFVQERSQYLVEQERSFMQERDVGLPSAQREQGGSVDDDL